MAHRKFGEVGKGSRAKRREIGERSFHSIPFNSVLGLTSKTNLSPMNFRIFGIMADVIIVNVIIL